VRLRAPRRASTVPGSYRPQLIGTVVANGERGSAIVGAVRIAAWIQFLYVGSTLPFLVALFALAGPLVGIIFVIASPIGFFCMSYASVESARDVVSAASAIAVLPS